MKAWWNSDRLAIFVAGVIVVGLVLTVYAGFSVLSATQRTSETNTEILRRLRAEEAASDANQRKLLRGFEDDVRWLLRAHERRQQAQAREILIAANTDRSSSSPNPSPPASEEPSPRPSSSPSPSPSPSPTCLPNLPICVAPHTSQQGGSKR